MITLTALTLIVGIAPTSSIPTTWDIAKDYTPGDVILAVGKKGGGVKKGKLKRDFNKAAKPTKPKTGGNSPTHRLKGPIWKPPGI